MPKEKREPNDFVKLAGTLAGIFLVITVLFLLFAKEQIVFLTIIAWAFVVLGIVLGAFMAKSQEKTRKR